MRGLINPGAYCSINSVVQCLYKTPELRDLIRRVDDEHSPRESVPSSLKRLVYEMSEDAHSPCNPSSLVDSMRAYGGVSFYAQEDSDAVFRCILEALARGCEHAKRIGALWDIKSEDCVRCLGCNNVQTRRNKSNTVPVFIEDNLPNELQRYIEGYSENTLTRCDYYCGQCQTSTQVEITGNVVSLPPAVCVAIQHVHNIGKNTANIVKLAKRVAFPENLDLKYMMKDPEVHRTVYELYAVVAHIGTHHCGHYTAYVRGDDDTWYHADDTLVRACSWEDVTATYEAGPLHTGLAYMLMYRRQSAVI
ncbi:ubl carboxyl-terminal hydrolase 18-like [Sander lucioperca]|uniref:ubl carboxyl-terminal hydrolase 18-like n=1 Tax=Sander lucioperca TaxID=283035 RepID=UPI00125D280E|nr:ubl carboxyl-terminal hydrolase 18-like [Sander lucioperca]